MVPLRPTLASTAPGQTWFASRVADAEAGFGGTLNAFELMKGMIEASAACVHFEDQLFSVKECGHHGGNVLVSTTDAGRTGDGAVNVSRRICGKKNLTAKDAKKCRGERREEQQPCCA